MLWTDSFAWITDRDLATIDPEITEVASANAIPLSGPEGKIQRGMGDAALDLTAAALQSYQSLSAPAGVTVNHWAAVMNTGMGAAYGGTMRLHVGQIVVSDHPSYGSWSQIKQFVAHTIMIRFYEAAMLRKDPDRFQRKLQFYTDRLDRHIRPILFAMGIPLISTPLAAPGAVMEPNSGTWAITAAADAGAPSMEVDVAITYVGTGINAESAPCDKRRASRAADAAVVVDITKLNPPTGTVAASLKHLGSYTPMKATGWNVYAGARNGVLYLQNAAPIPVATKTYQLPRVLLDNTSTLPAGQYPDLSFYISRTINRA